MRAVWITCFLCALPALAAEPQIAWVGDWQKAFKQARETGKPVMVCINSKDEESANATTAKEIYRNAQFVALSKRFVMIVVSTRKHADDKVCPRFGKVTCEQHLTCWKELRNDYGEKFIIPDSNGEMISPQHAWFTPGGALLRRKEYFLDKNELLKRMRAVLAEMKNAAPDAPAPEPGTEEADAPLNERDKAELQRLQKADKESRETALSNLLATEKTAVHAALVELATKTKNADLKSQVLRTLGKSGIAAVRPAAEALLKDRDAGVRSLAAVTLEMLGDKKSLPALLKRVRGEHDVVARRNVFRALGVCGGAAADKKAAKALLKAVDGEKQKIICRHAAYALSHYTGAAAKVVLKKVEKLALQVKDPYVRQALAYTLACIGTPKTSQPVLEKLLSKVHDEWQQAHYKAAIKRLNGDAKALSGSSITWEDGADPARR